MNEMLFFLNKHIEITKTVFWIPDKHYFTRAIEILEKTSIKNVLIISLRDGDKIKQLVQEYKNHHKMENWNLEYANVDDFFGESEENWALCVEQVEPEFLIEAIKWNPKYFLADIFETYLGAFKLWELFRKSTSYIQIKTIRKKKEPQVLYWEKEVDNDVELSVIFPMYNVASYLDQCIESVIKWKAPYVEFLFVNDGSPDNSRELVLKWAQKDSRVKLLDKENGGCASARQYGLERARGKYIGFIDPDDFIDESMFRKLLRAAMTGSYDVSYCGYNEYYENTKKTNRVEDVLGRPYCDGTTDQRKIWDLIIHCRVAIWRGIYKKAFLEKNQIHFYTDLRRFDDLPFKIEIFAAAQSIVTVQDYLYYYRLERPGQDVSANDERLYVHFDIFKYLDKSIGEKRNQILNDCLQLSKIQTHLYALKKIKSEYKKTYLKKAQLDLDVMRDGSRTYKLALKHLGEENAKLYKAIMENNVGMFE